MRTRRSFIGSGEGAHLSNRKGQGMEFADFKAYTPGDDYRHIDWGAYARTDRLYVKQFRQEEELNVMCLLDLSPSMSIPKEKLLKAKMLALALGYIAVSNGDVMSYCLLGEDTVHRISSAKMIGRISNILDNDSVSNFDFAESTRKLLASQRIPGKCIIISDFLVDNDSVFKAVDLCRAKGFEVALIQVLSETELTLHNLKGGHTFKDSETGEVLEIMIDDDAVKNFEDKIYEHNNEIKSFCLKTSSDYILFNTKENVEEFVLTIIPTIGLVG